MSNNKYIITIAGPTAVGKTETTISLAKQFDAEIFSADSRQLYQEMSIGTAKPTEDELSRARHHFIDHISINEHYNAGRYEREFDLKLKDYFKEKNIALVTGGTGMYIRAALEGLDDFPDIPQETRKKYEMINKEGGIESLQNLIKEKDPEFAAQVDLHNARRLTRALEVIDVSGKTFSSFFQQKEKNKAYFTPIKICLTRERSQLYDRINHRVDLMMENGLLKEAQSLLNQKELKALQTVGYAELFKHFENEISLEEAIELIKRNSRRYAKRQMTWFRNQGNWKMIEAENFDEIIRYIKACIK